MRIALTILVAVAVIASAEDKPNPDAPAVKPPAPPTRNEPAIERNDDAAELDAAEENLKRVQISEERESAAKKRKAGESDAAEKQLLHKLYAAGEEERTARYKRLTAELTGASAERRRRIEDVRDALTKARGKYLPLLLMEEDSIGIIRRPVRIQQITGTSSFIGAVGKEDVWFEGCRTGGQADGDRISVSSLILKCVGNKTYTNALGATRTVRRVEVLMALDQE